MSTLVTTGLSPSQRDALKVMYVWNGIVYADERDRTMMALRRRGLVEFHHRRRKYGRSCWHFTNVGRGRACQIIAADTRLEKM